MKVFSVCGISKSGKTTTIERIIDELSARGYRVGSVKEIHDKDFAIDPDPGSNTSRHRQAGAGLVCARGLAETDLLFPEKLSVARIISFYEGEYDWVVLEGVSDVLVPTIVTAYSEEDLQAKWNGTVFCVSGPIASRIKTYHGAPAINALEDIEALVDLIEKEVYDRMPDFPECCSACGLTCAELDGAILAGPQSSRDCVADQGITLIAGGRRIKMVPFVQRILRNAILGIVLELDGCEAGSDIEIRL